MPEYIDRRRTRDEAAALLRDAQVNPRALVALYLGLVAMLSLLYSVVSMLTESSSAQTVLGSPAATFIYILISLMTLILQIGFYLYCMGIRRGERMEFLTLFDGFSFAGRLIALAVIQDLFIFLWSMLFVVPGVIAVYRYRFAYLDLCENPSLGPLEALNMSKRQTEGYKAQIFLLDLSFLGWMILGSLPSVLVYLAPIQAAGISLGLPYLDFLNAAPAPLVTLVCGAWSLLVGIWYLARYQVCEISYFETAKRTSGVGAGMLPPDGGPDGSAF